MPPEDGRALPSSKEKFSGPSLLPCSLGLKIWQWHPHLDLGAAAPRLPTPTSHSIITLSMRHCALSQFLSCSYSLLTFHSLPVTVKEENGIKRAAGGGQGGGAERGDLALLGPALPF